MQRLLILIGLAGAVAFTAGCRKAAEPDPTPPPTASEPPQGGRAPQAATNAEAMQAPGELGARTLGGK